MKKMIPKERVLCVLNLGEPDRVPFCEGSIDEIVAAKLLGLPVPVEIGEVGFYQRPVEEEKALSRLLHRDVISIQVRAPIFAQKLRGKDGRLFYGEGLIKKEEDLELLKLPDPYDDKFYKSIEEFVRNKEDYAACVMTRLGIFPTMLSMGMEGFSYALYDNPRLVEKVLDIYTDWEAVVLERISQMGFDFIWSTDDLAARTGPLFSPQIFRSLVVPKLRKVVSKITTPWVHHSDGNILPIIEDLIGLGVKGIHPIEPEAMDINYVKKQYGQRICLIGNIDVNTLSIGTPQDVEEEVKKRIKEVAPGGGYMVSSGNSITAYCQPENVLAMAKAIQKYGKYPISIP